ncbi:MAG: hypothetical protein ACOYOH_27820 [Paracraurococcus sp.]
MAYDTEILSLIAPLDPDTCVMLTAQLLALVALAAAGVVALPYAAMMLLDLIDGVRAARRRAPCACKFVKAAAYGALMLKALL